MDSQIISVLILSCSVYMSSCNLQIDSVVFIYNGVQSHTLLSLAVPNYEVNITTGDRGIELRSKVQHSFSLYGICVPFSNFIMLPMT